MGSKISYQKLPEQSTQISVGFRKPYGSHAALGQLLNTLERQNRKSMKILKHFARGTINFVD
jgi:hypothetical protein